MKSFICVAFPGVLAQTLNQQPVSLYNGGTPGSANCAVKTNACDCHYASCSFAGDCYCGWDATTKTCQAGITTQCEACPSMGHCGVIQKLLIGPNGFPVPGQLSTWGKIPYPDNSGYLNDGSQLTVDAATGQSGAVATTTSTSSFAGLSTQSSPQTWQPLQTSQFQFSQPQPQQPAPSFMPSQTWPWQPQPLQSFQPSFQSSMASQSFQSAQPSFQSSWSSQASQPSFQSWQSQSTQSSSQSTPPVTKLYPSLYQYVGSTSTSSGQSSSASSSQSSSTQQTSTSQSAQGQSQAQAPVSLYQYNALPQGCSVKTNPCDCHYASCSPTGDCFCGWDATAQTCKAGIQTTCVSCPSMGRCGTTKKLLIGPDGFPVPGQLSVWGQVPYPDGSGIAGGTVSSSSSTMSSGTNGAIVGQPQPLWQPSQSQSSSSTTQSSQSGQQWASQGSSAVQPITAAEWAARYQNKTTVTTTTTTTTSSSTTTQTAPPTKASKKNNKNKNATNA